VVHFVPCFPFPVSFLPTVLNKVNSRRAAAMTLTTKTQSPGGPKIAADEALSIAHTDAIKAYRDLTPYQIRISLEPDGWRIDYELKDPKLKGGGPHYLIDARSGAILAKRYEQ
jgi:hypothetical protein